MTVQELLESKGITKEVIDGLPVDVVGHISGYVSAADSKLATATTAETNAAEALRIAELQKKEIEQYVENYGTSLTTIASIQAKEAARVAYLKTMKGQGFQVPDDLISETPGAAAAVVPGSPAVGGNAVDEKKILGKVGYAMAQYLDSNNEHIRLFGTPMPGNSEQLADEADRARKPFGQYVSEKFGFAARRQEQERAARQKEIDDAVNAKLTEERRKDAEARGGNPNLRSGESSRNSFVKPIKSEDFHKADGNVPQRTRRERMLERIHADVAAQSA